MKIEKFDASNGGFAMIEYKNPGGATVEVKVLVGKHGAHVVRLKRGEGTSSLGRIPKGTIIIAHGVTFGPDATISGGDTSTTLDSSAQIGRGSLIAESGVGRFAKIGDGCKLIDSFVGRHAALGKGVELVRVGIGDGATIEASAEIGRHCDIGHKARVSARAKVGEGSTIIDGIRIPQGAEVPSGMTVDDQDIFRRTA